MAGLSLTLKGLMEAKAAFDSIAPDPLEFRYNPLTDMGRYSSKFKAIRDANRSPLFPGNYLIPMVECEYIPEGIIVVWNKRPLVENVVKIIDLRD